MEKIVLALKIQPMELFLNYDDLSEVEAAQQEAIDQYVAAVSELSVKQIEALKRIVGEVQKTFKA